MQALRKEYGDKIDSLGDDYRKFPWKDIKLLDYCPIVKVKLEKPGIYMNTTPGVEMVMDFRPMEGAAHFGLWEGFQTLKTPPRAMKGTFNDWMAENYPEDIRDEISEKADVMLQKMKDLKADLGDPKV